MENSHPFASTAETAVARDLDHCRTWLDHDRVALVLATEIHEGRLRLVRDVAGGFLDGGEVDGEVHDDEAIVVLIQVDQGRV